jgi:hypothetical protein
MTNRTKRAAAALAVATLLGGFGAGKATAGGDTVRIRVPVCEEDEGFLKGKGDFNGRRWERYVCIHSEVIA